jgi:hypothetical protein
LLAIDTGKRIHQLLFQRYTGPIRTLVDNRYLFEPFWRAVRDHDSSGRWEGAFNDAKKAAMFAATGSDTLKLVSIVMDRLYVLRNQLVHGGATYAQQGQPPAGRRRRRAARRHRAAGHRPDARWASPRFWRAIEYPVIPSS